jgi:PAS domain S-box-containing protein
MRSMPHKLRTLLIAAVLFASPLLALDPSGAITQYGLSVWTTDSGLPQSSVNAIAQTRDGYLWFGTQEGLARFDGARFTIFDKRNTPALETHHINTLLVARDGTLWIGRNGGLTSYKDGTFRSYSQKDGLTDGFIWSLAEGQDGSIWIATYSRGLCRLHAGKFTSYTVRDGLPSDSIWSTYIAHDGTLWAGTNGGGLSHFANGRFTNYTTANGLANNIVWSMHQDRTGDLWIGTNDGLNRLHEGKLTKFTTADGLSNNAVKVIRQDRDGNLWIGTDGGGLNRYVHGTFSSFGLQQGLSDASVLSLYEDLEGSLWVGTSAAGVNQLRPGKFVTIGKSEGLSADLVWAVREASDGALLMATNSGYSRWKNGVMQNFSAPHDLSSNVVRAVLEDRDGGLWLGTSDGLNHFDHGKHTVYRKSTSGLSHDMIRSLAQDRAGNIWIGTRGGGLDRFRDGVFTVFSTANGMANDVVASMDEDADGALWIATNGGLSVLKDGRFRNYTTREGLSSDTVRTTHHDAEGAHWVGTYGGGLNRIKNGKIVQITSKDGLFDDVVFSILDDGRGYFWMTCNRGIFRVSKKELDDFADHKIQRVHSISYGVADGMKKAECNGGSPAAWKGSDGTLYFPTGMGVAAIHPARIWLNTLRPNVRSEEVLLDGSAVSVPADGLTVGAGRHSLEIHYTALSFLAPQKVRFRYRMRGFSEEWIDAADRREAFYTNLPPGDYTFEVMGSNNDGVWSAAKNPLRFRFRPAFYQTAWFWIGCAAVSLLAVRAAFHIRLKFLHERERVLVKRVDEQTAELMLAKTGAESVAEINTRLRLKNELILNSIADGVHVVDLSGTISLENPAASRMLGWEASSLVGQPAHETIHHSTLAGPYSVDDCPIHRTLRDGVLREVSDEVFWRKDGTSFPVHYVVAPILDGKGHVTGVAVTFRDITALKAIDKLKSEFVSTVSHELRTPLTSIRGALGLLGSGLLGPIAEKGQRMLDIAVANTDRLVRLINNILDLERMADGKAELTRAPVDAEVILKQATEGLHSIAAEADVRIVIEPASGTVWGDSDRIMQTLTNLLANAIKFSPPRTTVTVSGTAGGEEFVFCVADEGRGVPEEKLQTIFGRFSQVDSSDSRDKGGSGLGLAICKNIVTAHGGRIWAEKNYPAGSRFQFTIPLAIKEGQHAA